MGGGSVGAALWALDLESELVWVGDEGVTEESGRTRRIGADVEGRIRIVPWLWVDADVNLARGRSRDLPVGSNRIPLAPTFSAAGGVTVRDAGAVSGGARIRHIRRRPADEANRIQALGASLVELFARWSAGPFSLAASIENLFDVDWNEAQFATTSRLRGEPQAVTELHYTPGAPRSLNLGVEWRF